MDKLFELDSLGLTDRVSMRAPTIESAGRGAWNLWSASFDG